jgi:hypothetical protein
MFIFKIQLLLCKVFEAIIVVQETQDSVFMCCIEDYNNNDPNFFRNIYRQNTNQTLLFQI